MLGQRTSVMATGASVATTGTTKYIYDGNYQLTSVLFAGGGSDSFAYDAIGNRTIHGLAYTYYKNGTNTLNGNRLRSIGGTDYTYDANGNMTGHTGTTMYTWDAANRLVTDQDTTYTYDFADRRISGTKNSVTTRYISVGLQTIAERSTVGSTTTSRDYVFAPGIDEPLAMQDANGMTYYSVDGLGSVIAMTDAAGAVTAQGFDPWGVSSAPTGFFGYTGREPDGHGLWYLRARYYDPSIGRFISEDPLREKIRTVGSITDSESFAYFAHLLLRPYSYVDNNPVRYTDPYGLAPQTPGCDWPATCLEWLIGKKAFDCCYEHDKCFKQFGCSWPSWF